MDDPFEIVDILQNDIEVLANLMNATEKRSNALDRSYIRTTFSVLDGILFAFRKEMISSLNFELLFSKAERAFILEKRYDKKNDIVKEQSSHPSLKDSIRKNLKYFARSRGIKAFKFPETKGWQDMIQAIKIRDAITHPKSVKSLSLTNSELETVIRAKLWFKNEVMTQFK